MMSIGNLGLIFSIVEKYLGVTVEVEGLQPAGLWSQVMLAM